MNITALEAEVAMRFTLPKDQLKKAEERLYLWEEQDKRNTGSGTESKRSFSVFKRGRVYCSDNMGGGIRRCYHARITYDPATELNQRLLEQDTGALEFTVDLPFRKMPELSVTPAGLNDFTRPWSCSESSRHLKDGQKIESFYRAYLQIMGCLTTKVQEEELRAMVDTLYLPVKKGESNWWTQTGGGGQGGSDPTIVADKTFYGDMDARAEEQLRSLYTSVRDFSLRHGITTSFKFEDNGKSWAILEQERCGLDMEEHIRSSTSTKTGFYAPQLGVCFYQPSQDTYPELCYAHGSYTRVVVNPVLILGTHSGIIMPPQTKLSCRTSKSL